jgi:CxxC motif-containing protein
MDNLTDLDKPLEIICVACPHGCRLEATRKDGDILISNAGCKRGQEYAINEIKDPRRMVASTVQVNNGVHPLLPVSTSAPFPKGQITDLLREIRKVEISAPIKMGQVVLENVLNTGIDVVASRDLN